MLCTTHLTYLSSTLLLIAALGPVEAQQDSPDVLEIEPLPDQPPERCLLSNRISGTAVVDDRTVLFYMRTGEVYRNTLPRDCLRLKRNDRFTYETFSNQLCSKDTITVLERSGANYTRGATCRLGEYFPISEPAAEELLRDGDEAAQGGDSAAETTPVESPDAAIGGDDPN